MVTKEKITIRSASGNPEDTVILAAKPDTNVFYVRAYNATIEGFKIGAGEYPGVTGIYLAGSSNCTIENNDLSDNYLGIYLSGSDKNKVSNNTLNSNKKYGIQLVRSEENILLNNSADSNMHGIVLENNCTDNNLTGNSASSNLGNGLYLVNSSSNNFTNNTINENDMGIYLSNSNMSLISGNNISENMRYGLWVSHSHYNIIAGNKISGNLWAVHLNSSDYNTFYGNVIASSLVSGFSMCPACDNNTAYNNYLNNFINADIKNTKNTWNVKKTAHINIAGGPYLGGNFWANPDENGFSETALDEDENGIADTPYNETNVTDSLPLVSNLSAADLKQQILPDTNLTAIVVKYPVSKTSDESFNSETYSVPESDPSKITSGDDKASEITAETKDEQQKSTEPNLDPDSDLKSKSRPESKSEMEI
ncbi:MAG: right-handed parallel beta-helix repeat-containing protein [Methanosarcina sp.]